MKVVTADEIIDSFPLAVRVLSRNIFADRKYWVVSIDEYINMCKEAKSLDHNYMLDRFDCDDFSAVMYAYARFKYLVNGVARVLDFVSRHSYNIVYTEDGEIYVLEPQTCECWKIDKRPKRFYSLIFALIIW